MDKVNKYLTEAKDWKNDPWGARDEMADKLDSLKSEIQNIINPIGKAKQIKT